MSQIERLEDVCLCGHLRAEHAWPGALSKPCSIYPCGCGVFAGCETPPGASLPASDDDQESQHG
jgi:hypothetical protein